MKLRSLVELARAGDLRERVRAVRDGQGAVRAAMVGSAIELGLLDALRTPRTTADLAEALGVVDHDLLEAYLRTLAAARLTRSTGDRHALTRRGAAVVDDDVVRAGYEAYSGFHSGLYRDLATQLRGGPARTDVADRGEVIARLSRSLAPFLRSELERQVVAAAPRRVLDVGCGDGWHLAHMLRAAPTAVGVGIEQDGAAAQLARRTLQDEGVADRAQVVEGTVEEVLPDGDAVGAPFDVVLAANVVYYLPPEDRAPFLGLLASVLSPGGALVVVSTMAERAMFSRHMDLLLRAQAGRMSLPTVDEVTGHLRAAGLSVAEARRISPGEPLFAVVGRRADAASS